MITRRFGLAMLGASVLLLAGCSFGDKNSVDQIDKRAVERWNFLIAKQADKAYDYLSPGTRQTQSRETYAAAMNTRPVNWTSAKFNRKECDVDRCKVYIDVSYSVSLPGSSIGGTPIKSTSTQSEIWVHVDDGWYFLPK
jgi:hypothetical protein